MKAILLALVVMFGLTSCHSIKYQDREMRLYQDLEVKYELVNEVDASDVEGVDRVSAKYNFIEDKITLQNKGLFRGNKDFIHNMVHELIHWTGHVDRLNRIDLSNRVDWFLEEAVAEYGTVLFVEESKIGSIKYKQKHADKYLKRHPLTRELTESEIEYAKEEARKAVDYIYKQLDKKDISVKDINLLRTVIVNLIIGIP